MNHIDILSQSVRTDPLRSPQNTVGTVTTSYLSVQDYEKIEFRLYVGNIPTSATVNAVVLKATDSSGTGATTVTSGSITQLGDTDDDKMVSVDVHAQALLPTSAGGTAYTYAALRVTATDTCLAAIWANRYNARHGTVTQATAYAERVNVY